MDTEVNIGRNDINTIALHRQAFFGLGHGQQRLFSQERRQHADVVGIQMLDQDESESGPGGNILQELGKRFESPGGGTHAYYGKRQGGRNLIKVPVSAAQNK